MEVTSFSDGGMYMEESRRIGFPLLREKSDRDMKETRCFLTNRIKRGVATKKHSLGRKFKIQGKSKRCSILTFLVKS